MTYEHPTSTEPSGKAIASLVFGILGLVGGCPLLGSILAIVLGSGEPSSIARGGVICGWIGLALCALGVVVFVIMLVFGVAFSAV